MFTRKYYFLVVSLYYIMGLIEPMNISAYVPRNKQINDFLDNICRLDPSKTAAGYDFIKNHLARRFKTFYLYTFLVDKGSKNFLLFDNDLDHALIRTKGFCIYNKKKLEEQKRNLENPQWIESIKKPFESKKSAGYIGALIIGLSGSTLSAALADDPQIQIAGTVASVLVATIFAAFQYQHHTKKAEEAVQNEKNKLNAQIYIQDFLKKQQQNLEQQMQKQKE